jgi:hypothetical protein
MIKLPMPIYILMASVLALAFLLFAGEYIWLTANGKTPPDEVRTWLFSTLSALVAWFVSSEKQDDHSNGQ